MATFDSAANEKVGRRKSLKDNARPTFIEEVGRAGRNLIDDVTIGGAYRRANKSVRPGEGSPRPKSPAGDTSQSKSPATSSTRAASPRPSKVDKMAKLPRGSKSGT